MCADLIRTGIIGLGMGNTHAAAIREDKVPGLALSAICDTDPARRATYAADPGITAFDDAGAMMTSGAIDAVIIATPHFSHTTLGIAAFAAGLHVLVEKPISVHKPDCLKLLAAHSDPSRVFSAMFQLRTVSRFARLRAMIQAGELGPIRRINWIVTTWFRPQAYYDAGTWRATWAGEGGGVLLNQCPHQLDLWCWLFGLPDRVRAHCGFGRYHDIEVEDDVTAYLEYDGGATGVFIASTGDFPGSNRLEVTGDHGKVVVENDTLVFTRNLTPTSEFSRTTTEPSSRPETEVVPVDLAEDVEPYVNILVNFAAAIREGAPLIAPASEGIDSVELGNAMLLSTFENATIDLPIDCGAFLRHFEQRVATSKYRASSS